jgi:cytochrome c553
MGFAVLAAGAVMQFCVALAPQPARAWETWSADPATDTGNCATCHGKFGFLGRNYVSLHDQSEWSLDLMFGHGVSMLVGCKDCHAVEGDQPELSRCAGCHGREEDGGALLTGAGLVQHHRNAGLTECDTCHTSTQEPVGEHVLPAFMAAKGLEPCNDAQFGPDGLDNDGDGLRDGDDPDCAATGKGE